jgi:hypothetical protein
MQRHCSLSPGGVKMPNKKTHWAVRNINGTTGRRCECGSWITHWKLTTSSARAQCAVHNCGNDAEVGAHVMVTDGRTSAQCGLLPSASTITTIRTPSLCT